MGKKKRDPTRPDTTLRSNDSSPGRHHPPLSTFLSLSHPHLFCILFYFGATYRTLSLIAPSIDKNKQTKKRQGKHTQRRDCCGNLFSLIARFTIMTAASSPPLPPVSRLLRASWSMVGERGDGKETMQRETDRHFRL